MPKTDFLKKNQLTHVAIQITIRILCTYVCKYEFFEKKPKYHIYVTYRYVHYICMKRLYFTSTTFCFFLFLVSIFRDTHIQTHVTLLLMFFFFLISILVHFSTFFIH